MASNGRKNWGLKGFPVKRRRSGRGIPKYPVLARLKTGMQTDSSDDELDTLPDRWIPDAEERVLYAAMRFKHWRIRREIYHLPKFDGYPGHNPLEHVLTLFDSIDWCKPENLCWDAALLIAFPHSLQGDAKDWFKQLERRRHMTWSQMMDHFLNAFSESPRQCLLVGQSNFEECYLFPFLYAD